MTELEIIKYLIAEIEEEQRYNREYEKAKTEIVKEIYEKNKRYSGFYSWQDNMPKELKREPRQSVIKANARKIRQLLLKLY